MPRKKPPGLTLQQHSANLTAYLKSLIHECVTGQRRITEADVKRVGMQSRFDKREAKR